MPLIHAIIQCRNSGVVPEVEGASVDVRDRLRVMTNGFRIVFGRVFSSAWELIGHPTEIRWLDEYVRVERAVMLHSDREAMEGSRATTGSLCSRSVWTMTLRRFATA